MNHKEIIVTAEYKAIAERIKTKKGGFLFLTGEAGTGKTTFLKWLQVELNLRTIILAPTGIAALNARGQTLHSFFKFPHQMQLKYEPKFNIELTETLQVADLVVIDEISMVRADLLDNVNLSMQTALNSKEPFGGKIVLSIGDLYQLPPVLTNNERESYMSFYDSVFFFAANVFKTCNIEKYQLSRIFRQEDQKFKNLLNIIRHNTIKQNQIERMNVSIHTKEMDKDFAGIMICTTNATADAHNEKKLAELNGDVNEYYSIRDGKVTANPLPVPEIIEMKEGARVVLCKNTSDYKNGETGVVTTLRGKSVQVRKDDGVYVDVRKETWEQIEYKKGAAKKVGEYKQLPIKLGWAITIHKSQGMTFDCPIAINTGNGCFASGQFYVAISRLTKFENLTTLKPVIFTDIRTDPEVVNFYSDFK